MKAAFVETTGFTTAIGDLLSDEAYARLQRQLMANPLIGDVIRGCGGLRKVRAGDPRRAKGKRGGVRIVYLYIPAMRRFYMMDAYGKNEQADLTADERKELRQLVELLKRTANEKNRPSSGDEQCQR